MRPRCSNHHPGRAQGWQTSLVVAAATLAAGTSCGSARLRLPVADSAARRPNVVVIVTDDQTLGSVNPQATPNIYHWFVEQGRTYSNFFASDPLCAPSRAAILTGRYAHNNGVRDNDPGAPSFHLDMRSQIQCYLQGEGYVTGAYGKFYNGYGVSRDPPCLSAYAITPGDQHTGLPFRVNGRIVIPAGWQDDYIDRKAVEFLDVRARSPRRPFFLLEALLEPHSPYTALPKAIATTRVPPPPVSPSVWESEAQIAQKSPALRAHATRDAYARRRWDAEERMMTNVDRYVGNVFAALRGNAQLDDTIVLLMSDNGALFGQHHVIGKRLPYSEVVGVPAYLYGPRWIGPGASTDTRLAANVDVTPTILQATGIRPQLRHPLDGRSLLGAGPHRQLVLGESWHLRASAWQPRWRAIRSTTFAYVEYLTDGPRPRVTWREYYDLTSDPFEMNNLLKDGNPRDDPDVALLHAQVVAAAHCHGTGGTSACP